MSDPTSKTTDRWTEGVCCDGAAILYDGVSVSISCVLDALNDRDNLRGVLAEISAARTEADLFWDDADPEIGYQDIADIVDNYCPGEIVRIQRAVRLHDVFVVQIGDETRQFDDDKEAEAWVRSMEEIDDAKKL